MQSHISMFVDKEKLDKDLGLFVKKKEIVEIKEFLNTVTLEKDFM